MPARLIYDRIGRLKTLLSQSQPSDIMTGKSSIDMLLSKNRDILNRASIMADQKASIILGSEFIILSLIGTGIWRSSTAGTLPPIWSIVIFVAILSSVTFSLIVLLPSIGTKKKKPTSESNDLTGLLFFGTIADMEHDQYQERMKKLISSDEEIYKAIISDLYFEAKVLRNKKYKFLKLSYLALIFGVGLSLICFLIDTFL